MVEIELENFEEYYLEKLDEIFYKKKKTAQKLIEDIQEGLIDIRKTMNHFLDIKDELKKKPLRSLTFFTDKIKKEIDQIEIPEDEITYDGIMALLKDLKRLFTEINDAAKKSLPKFKSKVQPEIKELNYHTRKLGKKQAVLEKFALKKYTDVKEAEELVDKLSKFYNLRNNIENAREDLDKLEKEQETTKKELEEQKSKLLTLEKDKLFQKKKKFRDQAFKLKMKINGELGFKKALRKLKVEVERENIHLTNINENYVRDFIKNPLRVLMKEGQDLTKFRGLLVQLRHVLEEKKLNLKSDKREKSIEQINKIFDEREIYDELETYKELRENIQKIKKKIKKKGLDDQLNDVKNKIGVLTQRLEHINNDLESKNKDYLKYLAKLKRDRNNFQKTIEQIINEEIKIAITFSF
ncbi:MAG: hypothetical protein EU541_00910 [Promethearchaeota archaeon]|nr:MAG: hypothetical protein EU541_00910 [Candidatus Lokiarchaeota archaeon]